MADLEEKVWELSQEKKSVFLGKELGMILVWSVFLWVMTTYLTYGISSGIWGGIISILYVMILLWLDWYFHKRVNKNLFYISIAIILFSFAKVWRIGNNLNFYNNVSLIFLYIFSVQIVFQEKISLYKMSDYIPGFIKTFFSSIVWIAAWFWGFVQLWISLPKMKNQWRIVKGFLMGVPLVVLFSILFSSADMVFAKKIEYILNFKFLNWIDFTGQAFYTTFFAILFLGFFTYAFYKKRTKTNEEKPSKFVYDNEKHVEINMVLAMVSILFGVFVFFQIGYLFSGETSIISQWFTFAEYAKKWFTELTIVAAIIFIVLWKIDEYLYNHERDTGPSYKILSSILIILTLIIMLSAVYRLWVYQNAYGFTEARYYGFLYMEILFLFLVVTLARVLFFFKEWNFLITNISIVLVSFFLSNFINPESYVASFNLEKEYRRSLSIDYDYIWNRSADAIDTMLSAYSWAQTDEKRGFETQFCRILEDAQKRKPTWQAYNISYAHAVKLLTPMKQELNCTNDDIIDSYIPDGIEKYKKNFWENEMYFYAQAEKAMSVHEYNNAITFYEKSIQLNPRFERSYIWLAKVKSTLLQTQEQIDLLKKGSGICSDKCDDFNKELGNIYFDKKDYQTARIYFARYMEHKWYDDEIKYKLWVTNFSLWMYQEAINRLENVNSFWEDNIDMGMLNYYLASSYYSVGNYSEALKYVDKAIKQTPSNPIYDELKLKIISPLSQTGMTMTGGILPMNQ